jgi:hypothetical protein
MSSLDAQLLSILESQGYSSLSDWFIAEPALNLFSADRRLSTEHELWTPANVGRLLRQECEARLGFSFFARVTLFTTFTGFETKGWTQEHWMRFGLWTGMLDDGNKESASRSWDYLKMHSNAVLQLTYERFRRNACLSWNAGL